MSNDVNFGEIIKAYYSLGRFINGFILGITLDLAVVLIGGLELGFPWYFYLILALAGMFVTASAMVTNDIVDYEIDKINAPHRALPSGKITIRAAYIYGIILGLIGILFFALIDILDLSLLSWNWLWGLAHVLLANLYNYKAKRSGFLGNIIVAYTTGAVFLYADIFYNGSFTSISLTLAALAFLTNISREMIKGIVDTEGDKEFGIQTVAVRFGVNVARFFSITLLIMAMIIYLNLLFKLTIIAKILSIFFIVQFSYVIGLTYKANNTNLAYRAKNHLRISFLLSIVTILSDRVYEIFKM